MSEAIPPTGVDVDSVFAVLSNERRRLILEHLFSRPPPVSVSELVDLLATEELNGHERPEDLRDRVFTSLHHVHLPKLADSNMVDYDPDREEVVVRVAAAAARPHLALVQDQEHPAPVDRAD